MCRVLGIKSNNYYSYQKRKTQRPVDTTHQEMLEWVKDIAKFSDNTYGERRIQKALNALTNSEHNKPVYANELEQDFNMQQPNQAWVQDITYIWTSEG